LQKVYRFPEFLNSEIGNDLLAFLADQAGAMFEKKQKITSRKKGEEFFF